MSARSSYPPPSAIHRRQCALAARCSRTTTSNRCGRRRRRKVPARVGRKMGDLMAANNSAQIFHLQFGGRRCGVHHRRQRPSPVSTQHLGLNPIGGLTARCLDLPPLPPPFELDHRRRNQSVHAGFADTTQRSIDANAQLSSAPGQCAGFCHCLHAPAAVWQRNCALWRE